MTDFLFLSQRLPFPPDKGDKIRSYRVLKHLSRLGQVYLGCLIDEKEDWDHIKALEPYCTEIFAAELSPLQARLKSSRALLSGAPMSQIYFQNDKLQTWTKNLLAAQKPNVAFVFSSVMGQYIAEDPNRPQTVILDYVDVDSDKWAQYARSKWQPMKALFAREARTLLEFDRNIGSWATACTFVSEPEAQLFRSLAPELAAKTHVVSNGIDAEYFSPDAVTETAISSVKPDAPSIVFTGRMDYWPNVDAAVWFANEIFPLVKRTFETAQFTIAGAAPNTEVQRLGTSDGIEVTGRVDDIRPYILGADVVVAPLRIARGIQNKVLEGMALGKTVVTTNQGLEGIVATPGHHVLVADTAEAIAAEVVAVIEKGGAPEIGREARKHLVQTYGWEARMSGFDQWLPPN